MRFTDWINDFEPLGREKLLNIVGEVLEWIESYSYENGDETYWDVFPEGPKGGFMLSDSGIYAGSAGIALLYLRLFNSTGDPGYLKKAEAGINHVIAVYKGEDDFKTHSDSIMGTSIGYLNGPAGGAYVAKELYKINGDEKYRDFALRVAYDCIKAANEESGALYWRGIYGIISEGSLVLFLLDMYDTFGDEKFLEAAVKAGESIDRKKEKAPQGGCRWYAMPTDTFPTIKKAGGYFPGFEYGAAGCGYILAGLYEHSKQKKYLDTAIKAAKYIMNVADYSKDGSAALVRYNDTYLTDLYYLGVCQGPVGTSRLFYKLYRLTGEEKYKEFVIKLTNGLLASGAPKVHSRGYWRTNCYCCGAAGMLEHFLHMHRLSGEQKYLDAAYAAAEELIGASTADGKQRKWYTAWNRHEPFKSEAYTGLYHGSGGCAAALLALAQYIDGKSFVPFYLEDPYAVLYERFEFREIRESEALQAAEVESICFPPNEACSIEHMTERVKAAPELFLVALDKETGKIAGFLNGISVNEDSFRDEFFTDAAIHVPGAANVMLLGLDVLPEYRGLGLAKKLVGIYRKKQQERGSKRLVLTCHAEKIGMYEKFGFHDLGASASVWGGESWHEMDICLA